MKCIKRCGMTLALLCCGGLFSALSAADFSKKSDDELIKLSGSVKAVDFPDYKIEIAKRIKQKSDKDAQVFKEELKAQYEKATENMKVKELREYRKATGEAMKKRVSTMSKKERKELGFCEVKDKKDKNAKKGKDCHKTCRY